MVKKKKKNNMTVQLLVATDCSCNKLKTWPYAVKKCQRKESERKCHHLNRMKEIRLQIT